MKRYEKLFLLGVISLFFCIASVSASDIQSNDTSIIKEADSTINADNTNTINTEKIVKNNKNKDVKEASEPITVTSSNYNKYFKTNTTTGISNTTSLVKAGNTINLQGTFKNLTFNADKKGLTITSIGKKAKLMDCTIYVTNKGTNSKVYNLSINNTKPVCEGIILDHASGSVISDNTVIVNGPEDFAMTTYSMNKCTIKDNYFESTTGQTNLRIYSSDNNKIINNTVIGKANCIYLCAYGGDESNNNLISGNTVIGKSEYSICYPIQLMGNNNIVEKNTVIGGFRGISSENSNIIRYNDIDAYFTGVYTGENSTIENNYIHVSGDSRGITVKGEGSIVKNNKIYCNDSAIVLGCDSVTITGNDIVSKKMSIIADSSASSLKEIKVSGNNITGKIGDNLGNIVLSGNVFTNDSGFFTIKENRIVLSDDSGFVPECVSMAIYENNALIKNTNMKSSTVDYIVPSGRHYYTLLVTNSSLITNKFEVNNEDRTLLTLSINNINAELNTNTKLGGKLTKDNKGISNEKISIKIDDKTYTTTSDTNGAFSITYPVTKVGQHTAIFEHAATDKYLANKQTCTFTVDKINTRATISVKNVKYGETITITGKILDKNNKAIKGNVIINLNGKSVTVKSNSNGAYKYTTKAVKVGTNNITVTYNGNTNYEKTSTDKTFKVYKQGTKITLTPIKSVAYGENIIVTGKLTDKNGKILTNTNIKVSINGKSITTKTNTKGIYKYTTKAAKIGTNKITVAYNGNTNYNKITGQGTVKVVKQDTIVSVSATKKVKYGNKVTITGKLTDKKGKILSNTKIKVSVNGKSVTTKTNSKGVYKITRTADKMKVNNVIVSFAGNAYYNKISKKATFTVVKQNVIVGISSVKQVSNKKQVKITGKLSDANTKVIKNAYIVLKVNGVKKSAKTNSKGVYTLTVAAKTGKNTLVASFNGNSYYNKYTSKSRSFTIA